MKIKVTVKQLGKKHPFLKEQSLEIEEIGNEPTLEQFLMAVVKQQVEAFNQRKSEKNVLPFLTENEIEEQAQTGKVDFNESYNDTKANLAKAQNRVQEAFEDGIFAVFCDDEQLEKLNETILIKESSVFTFFRLTFLAGSFWY